MTLLEDWDRARQSDPHISIREFCERKNLPYQNTRKALWRERVRDGRNTDRMYETDPAFKKNRYKAEFIEDGNRATAESISRRIKTIDDLVEHLNIDLDIWSIERAKVNKWEGYRSAKKVNLDYSDGKIESGSVEDTGGLHIEPMFQVYLQLIKKEPLALMPVIAPVEVSIPRLSIKKSNIGDWGVALILADPHWGFKRDLRTQELMPFHDNSAIDVALQIANDLKPDTTVWAGDIIDLPDWTDKFLRSPDIYWTTQPAINEAAEKIAEFNAVSGESKVIEGNHDERLYRALLAHFIHAYDLRPADRLEEAPPMSIPGLLGLERLGIEYIGDYPNGKLLLNKGIKIVHGNTARSRFGATSASIIDKTNISVGYGHIHRIEYLAKTICIDENPAVVKVFTPGCLCRVDGSVPGSQAEPQWQQGIAVIEYEIGGYRHSIEMISIEDGTAYYRGKLYEGKT